MRGILHLLVGWAVISVCGASHVAASHLMRFADVHDDKIVFTYEGDLWLADAAAGDARRITNGEGSELYAKFSPDGKQLAFTAGYDGGRDVYIMPTQGGVPTRLTYHPANDRVLDWYPDGQSILFRARREYPWRVEKIFRISVNGGMPEKLPVDRAGLTAISPDAERIVYNRITREHSTWKRHQGGTAQDLWMGSPAQGDFKKITDWPGTDNFPMWEGENIYFTSDREHGTLNIYRMNLTTGKIDAMTRYADYDVKYPSLGTGRIVFQYGESLHLLNLADGRVTPVPVKIPSDKIRLRPTYEEVKVKKGAFSLSPTGKRMLLDARGDVLNLPVEEGQPVNVTNATVSREKNAAWSPDGKWIAFISEKTGEEEVYLVDQKGELPWRQLTAGGIGFRMHLAWSPDGKYIIFHDKFLRLVMVEVETGKMAALDQADYDDAWERWGIQDYVWSPDSKWIAYTKMEESGYDGIFLYNVERREIHRVTGELTEDWSPSFDPKGRYLYFLSNRTFKPVMGFADQNHIYLDMCRPYLVILADGEPSPFAPEESEDTGESEEDEKKDEEKEGEIEPIKVDLKNLEHRTVVIEGAKRGNYFRLEATEKGFLYLAKTKSEFSKYQVVTDHTGGELDLYSYDLEEKDVEEKTKKVISGIANYHLSFDGKKLIYRAGEDYGVIDTEQKEEVKVGDGKIELKDVRVRVDRNEEFLQIFDEGWRIQRDWFYDPGMHGLDWKAVREKYRRFVPFCGNRTDLTYLIGEMIAELNAGHTYVWGGDVKHSGPEVETGLLGVDFDTPTDSPYHRIAHIIRGLNWDDTYRSPLDAPDCPIKSGDYLIAIDGQEISSGDNVYRYLEDKSGKVITITYNDKPSAEEAKTYRAKTLDSERALRYREWVEINRAKVANATDNRIAYVHLPDMGQRGLIEFAKTFYPHHYKNGLVIDARYNGGGFTGDMIIDRLERKLWAITQPREGETLRDPERVFYGHMIVIINEDTGSNGEYFAEAIKIKGLAKLLGMRTWGGAVGIEPHQILVDDGNVTPPQFAPFGLNGEWLIEGHGVDPDIEVQNMPGDVVKGKDAQLQAAVKYILQKLKQDPMELPHRPVYPTKTK